MVDTDSFQPSFMQMILDDEPTRAEDRYDSPSVRYRAYKESVMRDLEQLLNHRSRMPFDQIDHDNEVLLTYGVTDFAHINISALSGRDALRRKISDAIRINEPRLSGVRVTLLDKQDDPNQLAFRIEAKLRVFSDAEPVVISASFEPARKMFNFQHDVR